MTPESQPKAPSAEFVALVALLTAMVAMSIDAMLPALGMIAADLGAASENHRQYVLTFFFGGLTLGTLVYGPLSDSIGRKPAIFAGLTLYLAGTLTCLLAGDFTTLLAGRAIQGFGASGPRIVSMAMVRDFHKGAGMARVMSFVMSVFMLVPILAPSVGQVVIAVATWRMIFAGFLVMASVAAVWLWLRQPETLPVERRRRLAPATLASAALEFVRNPVSLGYTLAVGCIFGAFICYLATSQQIFVEQYGQGALFAMWFGVFAVGIAMAMIFNAQLVLRFGMRNLSKWALRGSIVLSALFLAATLIGGGHPPFWTLAAFFFFNFFCCGILFGNYNAIAMEPMGHIAGMAAAISGGLSSLLALVTGSLIGQMYDGSVMPVAGGFFGLALCAFILTEWAESRRR